MFQNPKVGKIKAKKKVGGENKGYRENRTPDLLHPKQESYH